MAKKDLLTETHREVGEVKVSIENLETDVHEIKTMIKSFPFNAHHDRISTIEHEWHTAKRAAIIIGSSFAGFVAWIFKGNH